jgi:hypothetical protein
MGEKTPAIDFLTGKEGQDNTEGNCLKKPLIHILMRLASGPNLKTIFSIYNISYKKIIRHSWSKNGLSVLKEMGRLMHPFLPAHRF